MVVYDFFDCFEEGGEGGEGGGGGWFSGWMEGLVEAGEGRRWGGRRWAKRRRGRGKGVRCSDDPSAYCGDYGGGGGGLPFCAPGGEGCGGGEGVMPEGEGGGVVGCVYGEGVACARSLVPCFVHIRESRLWRGSLD